MHRAAITSQPSSTNAWRTSAVCLVLAAITFAIFGQTVGHDFVDYDDNLYVYENPMVASGLTGRGMAWAFTHFHSANWHPLTWISHMVDCQLYGLRPGGHHLTNVVLHAAAVVALFLVLRRLTGGFWRCAFAAAVFAIHPLRVESVAWVAERKDVLSGLFFILTIGAYAAYARRPASAVRYGLVMLLFVMGLMCKPMLVTLPLILLLLDYWPLRRMESAKLPRLAVEKLPLLVISAASCAVTIFAQKGALQSTEAIPLSLRVANAVTTCAIYLRQMIYPAGLAVFYPYPHDGPAVWQLALAVAVVAGISAVAWRRRRTEPWLLVGWLWYLIMLAPVVGIIQVGTQAHADRYTYLPQIGIYVGLIWLAAEMRLGRLINGCLMAVVIGALMVCAWQQTGYWQNSQTLWSHALACTKDNYVAHSNLGSVLMDQGKVDEAIPHFEAALVNNPVPANVHNNLGTGLFQTGRTDEAIAEFQKALQIDPNNAGFHYNLGWALAGSGRVAEAIAQYETELRLEPDDVDGENNLAWLLATSADASLRNGSRAVELAQKASQQTGGDKPFILQTLAAALAEAGRCPEAAETARRALQLARAQSHPKLAAMLDTALKLYEAGKPLRVPPPAL